MNYKVLCEHLLNSWRVSSSQLMKASEEKRGVWTTQCYLASFFTTKSLYYVHVATLASAWNNIPVSHLRGPKLSIGYYIGQSPHPWNLSFSMLCNQPSLLLASSSSSFISSAAAHLSIVHRHSFTFLLKVTILVQAFVTSSREWERFQKTRFPPKVERFINRVWWF